MNKRPHNYAPDEKVTILKTDLIDQIPISDICHQYNLQPTVFYRWPKEFFANGATAFIKIKSHPPKRPEKPIPARDKKLPHQNEMPS